ncbi:MAG: hypothetical protein Q8P12_03350 [bacterium]|nr:hypothetical protein [bacterium]
MVKVKVCRKEGSMFTLRRVAGDMCPNCFSPLLDAEVDEKRVGHLIDRELPKEAQGAHTA